MLKRHQILLTDWLEDYIRFLSENYDVSFSEVIRGILSLQFIQMISILFPRYKSDLSSKEIARLLKKAVRKKEDQEELHRLISQIYFSAHKAIEYRLKHVKKLKKGHRYNV